MRAGALDRRIQIQENVEVQNATTGEVTTTWTRKLDCYAYVRSVEVQEEFGEERIMSTALLKFTIRYLPWLSTKYRVLYEGLLYDIRDTSEAEVQGRKKFSTITARLKE